MARNAYDKAEPLDTTGLLTDAKDTLEAAEVRIDWLVNDQENILSQVLTEIDDAVPMFLSGDTEQGHNTMHEYLLRLTDSANRQWLSTAIVDALYAQAQEQYSGGNAWIATYLLRQREGYAEECSSENLTSAEEIEAQIAASLSGLRPKNGATLERAQGAGRNIIEITAGEYDICVKLGQVENPAKHYLRTPRVTRRLRYRHM